MWHLDGPHHPTPATLQQPQYGMYGISLQPVSFPADNSMFSADGLLHPSRFTHAITLHV
jgi:hypothetical protein